MSTAPRRATVLAAGLVAVLALAGCGSNGSAEVATPQGAGESSASAAARVDEAHNDLDAMFVAGMVPHHEGAVSMSELAEERAQSAEVKDLARRIAAAQEPEIELMQEMASAWDVELDERGGHAGHGGMEMGDDTEALEGLEGAEFDRAFLTSMIEHHEGAIPMSRMVLDEGENPQAKELAAQIIEVQEREIAEMEQLLTEL